MKKIVNTRLFYFILGAIIFGSVGLVSAYTLFANNIGFESKDTSWQAKNVKDAIDDLYVKSSGGLISGGLVTGDKNIVVYKDDEKTNDFPDKEENFMVEKIECTNDATATFNSDEWKLEISNISSSSTVCSIYFSSKVLYSVVKQNLDNEERLTDIFSKPENVVDILAIDDDEVIAALMESQAFRTAIYDNYQLTEPIIANSTMILDAMKNSSRYQVVSRTGQYKNFYSNKAFVFGFSYVSTGASSYGNYNIGTFLSSSGDKWNPSSSATSSEGLSYRVNKFASSVNVNGIYGVSVNWDNPMYAAIFKIE